MIFHNHKTIFFHIPKTAGYTIERFLDTEKNRNALVFHPDVIFGLDNGQYTQHLNYTGYKKYISEDTLHEYYKFTFVRNTWDRLVSAFTYLYKGDNPKYEFKKILKIKCDELKNNKLSITDHYNTQLNYIFDDNGKMIMDFIGRFENIQEDFEHVCSVLNIPFCELKKKNSSKRECDYRFYYDDELINLVYETYNNEINYFGFNYE